MTDIKARGPAAATAEPQNVGGISEQDYSISSGDGQALAAVVYRRRKSLDSYHMIKLFGDGTSAPIRPSNYGVAARWLEAHGYRALGYWLNNGPAIVWARQQAHFEAAWGEPALRAPVRFGRASNPNVTAHQVGDAGYILPTRSRAQVFHLRQRFPFYQGDLLMVPREILYRLQRKLEARDEARQAEINEMLAGGSAENRRRYGWRDNPSWKPVL